MPLVKLLEGCHIALSRLLSQCVIRFRLRLDFGCGHVFVLGQGTKKSSRTLVHHLYHESACFKEAATFSSTFPCGLMRGVLVALNAGVMQRFERVVALPDPKDIEFPQPRQHFLQIWVQVQ
jgi:hypothetical protein